MRMGGKSLNESSAKVCESLPKNMSPLLVISVQSDLTPLHKQQAQVSGGAYIYIYIHIFLNWSPQSVLCKLGIWDLRGQGLLVSRFQQVV